MDGDQQLLLYWIDPVDAAESRVAKPEVAAGLKSFISLRKAGG